jgi:AcrR family transcriptional regulator
VAARCAEDAGVEGLIVEGTEGAAFRNPEEVHTLTLVPAVRRQTGLPIVAAGGIADGAGVAADRRGAAVRGHRGEHDLRRRRDGGEARPRLAQPSPVSVLRSHILGFGTLVSARPCSDRKQTTMSVPETPHGTDAPAPEPPADVAGGPYGDDERRRLLIAAKQVLERSGWWGFKVEGVLRQASLSTRSFYRHFEKKSDLLAALMEMELGGAAIKLQRRCAAGRTSTERIDNYLSAMIDMAYEADLARPSSLFASHWREMLPEYGDAIDRSVRKMIQPLIDAIVDGTREGTVSSPAPDEDAKAIFYLVSSMTADQAVSGGRLPREDLERCALPFVHRAIGLR